MGTNYYLYTDICECCDRGTEVAHIGKTSAGWVPLLRLYDRPHETIQAYSWEDWKEEIVKPGRGIKDEYGERLTAEEFVEGIEKRMRDDLEQGDHLGERRRTVDGKPYRLYAGEFS